MCRVDIPCTVPGREPVTDGEPSRMLSSCSGSGEGGGGGHFLYRTVQGCTTEIGVLFMPEII